MPPWLNLQNVNSQLLKNLVAMAQLYKIAKIFGMEIDISPQDSP